MSLLKSIPCWLLIGLVGFAVLIWFANQVLTTEDDFSKGENALVRGDWLTVSRQIEALKRKSVLSDEIQFLRGGLLLRTGNTHEAIAELMRIRSVGGLRQKSQLLLCEAFYQLKQFSEVVAVGRDLLRRDPDLADAHRWLGATYFDLGDLTQAEFHLKELARLEPKDYSPYRLLGVMHKDFERYQEAIVDFQRALDLEPPPMIVGEIRLALAQTLIQQNQFEEALRTLEFEWPENAVEPRVVRAECLWTLNRHGEAKQQLLAAQRLEPSDRQALWMSVRIALDEERTTEALHTLQKLVDAEPTNHQALYEISLAYRRLGKDSEAQEFLERRNVARALFERLVELNKQAINEPQNASVRLDLAKVCEQLGKKELAIVWRDAASALDRDAGKR